MFENAKKNCQPDLIPKRLKIFKTDAWKGIKLDKLKSIEDYYEYFDAIHVGAKADMVPELLYNQLKPGGRMFIPLEKNGQTHIYIVDKPINDTRLGPISMVSDLSVRYVPLQKTNNV